MLQLSGKTHAILSYSAVLLCSCSAASFLVATICMSRLRPIWQRFVDDVVSLMGCQYEELFLESSWSRKWRDVPQDVVHGEGRGSHQFISEAV